MSPPRLILALLMAALLALVYRRRDELGAALVEALAYASDRLSDHQDAVAAESYLGTAGKRASVRRHARLVDAASSDQTGD